MAGNLIIGQLSTDVGTNLYITPNGSVMANVPFYSGAGATTPLSGATNPVSGGIQSANNYIQKYVYNTANGTYTSADFTAYPANGNDASGWVDMGITSLAYNQAAYSVTGPNEGYILMSAPAGSNTSGNLVIATDSTGSTNAIQFYTGGFTKAKSAYAFQIGTAQITAALPMSGVITSGTAQASTSGTAITFTGIPSWVKRVTVMFNGVSTSGTSNILIQVGSGSVITTGYTGQYNFYSQGSSSGGGTLSAGFLTINNNASGLNYGSAVIYNISGNTWVCSTNISLTVSGYVTNTNGIIALSGILDRVVITTVNGTDTFDAGSINIQYEG